MSQRTKVVGTRSPIIWLLIVVAVIVIAAVLVGVLVLLPQRSAGQHYRAGLAFETAEEWEAAKQEYMQVIVIDAGYKDTQARLAEVKTRLTESAVAQAEQAQATAQAQATNQAQVATSEAEARATDQAIARATEAAAPAATAEALETRYQRALGHINLEQWVEAQAELKAIFDIDPNYKDVQSQLAAINTKVAGLTPTATQAPPATPVPVATDTPAPPPTPSIARASHFDGTNTEGWTTSYGSLVNPGSGGSGGGPNNGCLIWTGGGSGTSYYIATSRYYGDWRGYSELRLDVWSAGGDYFTKDYGMYGDIFLASGRATAQRLLSHRPSESWETFVIPLTDSGEWIFGGGATKLEDVLVNVTDFQIRSEYGVGGDESGLDNVELFE